MSTDRYNPAFPRAAAYSPGGMAVIEAQTGLTASEHAAIAMQAMITKSSGQDSTGGKAGVPLIAKYAFEYADAMLAGASQKDQA